MKTILFISIVTLFSAGFTSCSKCYDCIETQEILDSSGNVIDETEVHESVCTADQDEISRRETNGAVCS